MSRQHTKDDRTDAVQKALGKRIKELRRIANFNQETLGAKIELSSRTLSEYERGNCLPSMNTLIRLADALETPLEDLFHFDELAPHDTEARRAKRDLARAVASMDATTIRLVTQIARLLTRHRR